MMRQFTGKHMAAILIAFFGVVAAVNFTMASYANSTFGGIVVENSYVASQEYNKWLEAAENQSELGWTVESVWQDDGRIALTATGPSSAAKVSAVARHPLGHMPDQQLAFTRGADGRYVSNSALPHTRWIIRFEIDDGAKSWRREDHLQ